MNRLATASQLRASLLRWIMVLVPATMLLGYLSGMVAGSAAGNPWFAALEKPATYPPAATFGIVWGVLYAMMGLSLALVCAAWRAWYRTPAIIAFCAQFALNLAWSPMFFAQHQITVALAIVLLLDIAVVLTIWLFWKVRRAAALLLLPYLAWILFATVLNWQILQLNPSADGMEQGAPAERIEF